MRSSRADLQPKGLHRPLAFGSQRKERRASLKVDDEDGLERERKLEGYLICFLVMSAYKGSMDQAMKSICHTQICGSRKARITLAWLDGLLTAMAQEITLSLCHFFRHSSSIDNMEVDNETV